MRSLEVRIRPTGRKEDSGDRVGTQRIGVYWLAGLVSARSVIIDVSPRRECVSFFPSGCDGTMSVTAKLWMTPRRESPQQARLFAQSSDLWKMWQHRLGQPAGNTG